MKMSPEVVGQAEPRGHQPYRQWLSRTWEPDLPIALVIGINPNNATEKEDDGMTGFLVRLLRGVEGEFQCGGYVLVNCYDYRDRKPKAILDIDTPSSSRNIPTIRDKLKTCDFVVVSWGNTDYGEMFQTRRKELAKLIKDSGKPAICFSPRGAPVYCSQTNANAGDGRWSSTPILWSD
jgi:hypothetical protein